MLVAVYVPAEPDGADTAASTVIGEDTSAAAPPVAVTAPVVAFTAETARSAGACPARAAGSVAPGASAAVTTRRPVAESTVALTGVRVWQAGRPGVVSAQAGSSTRYRRCPRFPPPSPDSRLGSNCTSTWPAAVEASLRATPKTRPSGNPARRTAAGSANRTCTFAGAAAPLVAGATHTGDDPTRAASEAGTPPFRPAAAFSAPSGAGDREAVAVPAAGRSTAGSLPVRVAWVFLTAAGAVGA
jgi:hypothetical protein